MKNDVVVLIPHYNDMEGLEKSVMSISEEEFVDVLIVDDGSKKSIINEARIRTKFKAKGEIIFLYLIENKGIESALNYGLDYIKSSDYNFIARLDSGDICLGKRFQIQRDFLQRNPEIKLIGSNVLVKDTKGVILYKIIVPTDSKKIKNGMYLSSTVIHPSIMFKKEVVTNIGYYPTEYKAAEDYAYYFKILKKYQFSNIDDFLLEKELNPESISIKNRKTQAFSRIRVIVDNFYFGFYPIYGLIRNYLLYITPNGILVQIKKLIFK